MNCPNTQRKGVTVIIISSTREGFRRCGLAHPKKSTEHADDAFSKKQLAVLAAEPMLTVQVVEDEETITTSPLLKDLTVPRLKALCTDLEITYSPADKKADLIALVEKHTAEPPAEKPPAEPPEE